MVLRAQKTEFKDLPNGNTMAYRYLGRTGLKVSVLSYGTWLTTDANN
jgi:hypothetical protein